MCRWAKRRTRWSGLAAAALLASCAQQAPPSPGAAPTEAQARGSGKNDAQTRGAGNSNAQAPVASNGDAPAPNPLRNVYFGDLHLHTRNSFDAYIFNVRATPEDAYAYA
jgi:hypothetical protein